ncbi:MAG: ABC transporter permease subunit [Proteobacteria bacterium]|nr:ABC transporter permease subunit [Pseudomonadota bacterium]
MQQQRPPPSPARPRPGSRAAAVLRQALAFGLLGGALFLMFHLTAEHLRARGIRTGFDFLWQPATTPVFDSPLSFQAGVDSFAKAFAAGALNSLKITAAAIVAATLFGLLVGLGRMSGNALARALCGGYVELMRNVPVLLHIFFWYGLVLELPAAADLAGVPGAIDGGRHWLLATNRGVHLAWFGVDDAGHWGWQWPRPDGLQISGGLSMTPEFLALFIGLSLYTAAFVAEIVRAAVEALPAGQWQAAAALGLRRHTVLARVILPQALRIGLPALTSEYLGLFKNSTLAVAIGYQDFMAVSNTMLTDTGQAVEVMAVVMAFYVLVSLLVSALMHAFERRSQRGWGRP